MSEHISKEAMYEVPYQTEIPDFNKILIGYIDCIDKDNVWEFKCVDSIDKTYFLQIALYMFLINKNELSNKKEYFLLNILNNDVYSVYASNENLEEMVAILFNYKYNTMVSENDKFIENNIIIKNKYNF